MHNLLITLTSWLTNHPNLTELVIFFTSSAESLAFIGLIMPGAALMLTAGALIATGALSFWPTMGSVSIYQLPGMAFCPSLSMAG